MKNIKFLIVLLISLAAFTPFNETKAQSMQISFSNFQRELSPYGRWQNNPRYGQVWIYNEPGFRPYYSNGYWDYTEYGWEWVSDYDWGWAPFHYGRWEYDPYDGWMWIPGYDWAPAWVSWSSYDGYYGWAPMGYGININISFGSIPYDRWTFIPRQNICDRNLSRYYVSPQRNYGFRNAVIIDNVYNGGYNDRDRGRDGRFFRGPDRDEAQRYTNNRIEERKVDYREKTGAFRRGDDAFTNNNGGRRNDNRNDRQAPTVFDRMNKGQDDVRNNDQRNNFPQRQEQQQQRDKVTVFDRMNQQQQEERQRDQQIEQQKRLQQQQEQIQRQQQADQQQRQQQQQMEQQRQQRQQQNRPQQDYPKRQQPEYQGPPIREQRTETAPQQQQRTERRRDDNNNNDNKSGGFFGKRRGND